MTAEIVNLSKFRKARARADRERQAEENRLKYGQSKGDRQVTDVRQRRTEQTLDGAKRGPGSADHEEGDGPSNAS